MRKYLRARQYRNYIRRSPIWALIREREHERAGHCCEFCGWQARPDQTERFGPTYGLHVHHLTYDHLGNEPSCDLIVLCAYCHDDVHEFPKIAEDVQRFAANRVGVLV